MNSLIRWFVLFLLGTAGLDLAKPAGAAGAPLDFKEVYDLIRSQLPDLAETTLYDAAAQGIIRELSPRVQLVAETNATQATASGESIQKSTVLEGAYAYCLIGRVGPDSPQAFQSAWDDLNSSNQLKGLILDLRFAAGENYKSAARLGDRFFHSREPLVDWGQGVEYSETKTNAITVPVVVLINGRTCGAAEALAGILRYGTAALLIGAPTAGQASIYREFTLTTGQRLRIAVQPITLGKDAISITAQGLSPDLVVTVPPDREKAWIEDPYKVPPQEPDRRSAVANGAAAENGTSTTTPRRRINEADLVRMLREGELPELGMEPEPRSGLISTNIIRDPVLARGLDFLKGLAVMRQLQAK